MHMDGHGFNWMAMNSNALCQERRKVDMDKHHLQAQEGLRSLADLRQDYAGNRKQQFGFIGSTSGSSLPVTMAVRAIVCALLWCSGGAIPSLKDDTTCCTPEDRLEIACDCF